MKYFPRKLAYIILFDIMLKHLLWNVRGVANGPTIRRINFLIKKHNLNCFAVVEPKDITLSVDHYKHKFRCEGALANVMNTIWFFGKMQLQSIFYSVCSASYCGDSDKWPRICYY